MQKGLWCLGVWCFCYATCILDVIYFAWMIISSYPVCIAEPLEELYEDQLSQLRSLGFRLSVTVMTTYKTSGDVHAAALLLLQDL